jgi:hypothetical protein
VGDPCALIRARAQERPHLGEEWQSFLVVHVCDPAHRRKERDQSVAIERLLVRDVGVPQWLEPCVDERAAPLAVAAAWTVEVERLVVEAGLGPSAWNTACIPPIS